MLYAPGLTDVEIVRTICSAVSKPVNVLAVPASPCRRSPKPACRRISLGSKLTTFAFGMMETASREMLRDGTFGFHARRHAFRTAQACSPKKEDG